MMVVQGYFNSQFIKSKFNATTEEIIQKDLLCQDEVKEYIFVVDADDEIIAEDVIVTDKMFFNNKIKTEVLTSVSDSYNDIIFSNQRKSKDESKDFHSIKKVPSMIYQNTLEHTKTRSTSDSHIVQATFEKDGKVISEKFGNWYNCLECSNKFSDKIVLAAHSLLYHKTVRCDLCDKWHKKRMNPFKCLECTDSLSHERYLLKHNLSAHNKFRSSKTIRKLNGENGSGFLSHLNHAPHSVNVKDNKFKCSKCDSLFVNESSLSTHYLSTHSMTPKRNSSYKIQTFYDEDKKINLFTCQNCSSQFPSVYRLINHSYHMHCSVKEGQFAFPVMLQKSLATKTVKKDSKFYYREKLKCSFKKNNEILKIPLKSGKKSHQPINVDQLKSQEIFGNILEVLTSNEVSKEVNESNAKEPLKCKEVAENKDKCYAKILQEVPKYEKITKFEDEVMKDEVIIIVVDKEAEKHPLHRNQNFRKEWDSASAAVNYTMHSVREEEKEMGNADNLRCSKCNLTFCDLVGLYNHSQSEHEIENQPKRQRKSLLKQISSIHRIRKPYNCPSAKNIPCNNFKTNKATLLANYSLKFTNGRSILRESNIIKLKVQNP